MTSSTRSTIRSHCRRVMAAFSFSILVVQGSLIGAFWNLACVSPPRSPPPVRCIQDETVATSADQRLLSPGPEGTEYWCGRRSADDSITPSGEFILVSPSGGLLVRGTFYNGVRHGLWIAYDESGRLREIGEFRDGAPFGPWFQLPGEVDHGVSMTLYAERGASGVTREWDRRGMRLSEMTLMDGREHGESRAWREDGTLLGDREWLDGTPAGRHRTYWRSGTLKLEAESTAGELSGPAVRYFQSGEVLARGKFEGGVPDGDWTYSGRHGESTKIERYNRGRLLDVLVVGQPGQSLAARCRAGESLVKRELDEERATYVIMCVSTASESSSWASAWDEDSLLRCEWPVSTSLASGAGEVPVCPQDPGHGAPR